MTDVNVTLDAMKYGKKLIFFNTNNKIPLNSLGQPGHYKLLNVFFLIPCITR